MAMMRQMAMAQHRAAQVRQLGANTTSTARRCVAVSCCWKDLCGRSCDRTSDCRRPRLAWRDTASPAVDADADAVGLPPPPPPLLRARDDAAYRRSVSRRASSYGWNPRTRSSSKHWWVKVGPNSWPRWRRRTTVAALDSRGSSVAESSPMSILRVLRVRVGPT